MPACNRQVNSWMDLFMARPERFELPTPWFVARYSIQLSYGRVFDKTLIKSELT